ncbi:hypothetical protein, partial [Micromonospora sp. 4G55]|uniref:hypothetical protein n=1 Tax=Micromonospora sp. 4G55 TaxID=2806102 RepID=UPI001A4B936D
PSGPASGYAARSRCAHVVGARPDPRHGGQGEQLRREAGVLQQPAPDLRQVQFPGYAPEPPAAARS